MNKVVTDDKNVGEWIFEDGFREGYRRGRLQVVNMEWEEWFGPLPAAAVEKVMRTSCEDVDRFAHAARRAKSLSELGLEFCDEPIFLLQSKAVTS